MKIKNVLKRFRKYREEYKKLGDDFDVVYLRSDYKKKCVFYAHCLLEEKLDANLVLYESFSGRSMSDNPYAVFRALYRDESMKHLKHVWVLDDFADNSYTLEKYRNDPRVIFIKYDSDDYLRYLARSKYLVNNTTFPAYFVKREGQVYLNTWHGTPIKSMGYETKNGNTVVANIMRNYLCCDYMLSANQIMTDMYLKSCKLDGIYPGKIVEEGYPRNDLMFDADRDEVFARLRYAGVEIDENKQIILYAPTWKQDENSKAVADPEELIRFKTELEKNIDTDRYQILIKPHQIVYKLIKDIPDYKGMLIPSTIDANELMSVTDVMISDYSSIFVDFMVLRRPILFYIPDLDSYLNNRGLKIMPDQLPGPNCETIAELADAVNRIDETFAGYRDRYEKLRSEICGHDDGRVSERICRIVWHGETEGRILTDPHAKKRLLISAGFLKENGIMHSFLSLLNQLDYDEWDVTVYVAKTNSKGVEDAINEKINPNARVLLRVGIVINTKEEEVMREFVESRGLYKQYWRKRYPYRVYDREYIRCFGNAEFDYVVNFSGFSRLDAQLLLRGKAKKRSIWMHSDMKSELDRTVNGEKPNRRALNYIFSLYPEYDHLVACGRTVMEVNKSKLGTKDNLDKFTYVNNAVNTDRIYKGLEAETVAYGGKHYLIMNSVDKETLDTRIQMIESPDADYMNFVTMGRLSTEKNQDALIRAFGRFRADHDRARLYLLGDGPLMDALKSTIGELGLEDSVFLMGNVSNPFAFMEKCDCFVLPSFYEGMPMVLLEARCCGLPIIVSNFESVSDSLVPDGQLVIEFDEDSIYRGLTAFSEGKVPVGNFHIEDYNRSVYEQFARAIV